MSTFRFSLQTLLKVKEKQKKDAMNRSAYAKKQYDNQLEILKSVLIIKSTLESNYCSEVAGGLKSYEFKFYNDYFKFLNKRISEQQINVQKAEEKLYLIKKELKSLYKDIKVLEKLKEKQYEEYLEWVAKEEEKRTEELLSYKLIAGGGLLG